MLYIDMPLHVKIKSLLFLGYIITYCMLTAVLVQYHKCKCKTTLLIKDKNVILFNVEFL